MLGSRSNSYFPRAATVARRLFPGSKNSWFVSVVGGIVRSGSNVAGGCYNLMYSMSEVSVHLRLGRSNGYNTCDQAVEHLLRGLPDLPIPPPLLGTASSARSSPRLLYVFGCRVWDSGSGGFLHHCLIVH